MNYLSNFIFEIIISVLDFSSFFCYLFIAFILVGLFTLIVRLIK